MNTEDIALIVDEPVAGHFYWILQQRDGGQGDPRAVDAAPGPMPSYGSALMAGIAALQRRTQHPGAGQSGELPIIQAFRTDDGGGPAASGPPTLH